MSGREIAAATRKIDGEGIVHATIYNTMAERDPYTVRVLSLIARAVGVKPNYFAEVRLAQARHLLDERDPPKGVGLEQALRNLKAVEALLFGQGEDTGGNGGQPET